MRFIDEYENLKDFAIRMIETSDITKSRKIRLKDDVTDFIEMCKKDYVISWDHSNNGGLCGSDLFDEVYYTQYAKHNSDGSQKNKYYNQFSAIIRASIDVAFNDLEGGGVIGFDMGFIRRMYPDGLPDWVKYPLELSDDMPDDLGIWL